MTERGIEPTSTQWFLPPNRDDLSLSPIMPVPKELIPESIMEKIHDIPENFDAVWREAKKRVELGISVPRGYWTLPEIDPSDDEEWLIALPVPSALSHCEFPPIWELLGEKYHPQNQRGASRTISGGWFEFGGGLGYSHFPQIDSLNFHSAQVPQQIRDSAAFEPGISRVASGSNVANGWRVEAPLLEAISEAALGQVDTLSIRIDGTVDEQSVLLDVLGHWVPYDFEKSEVLWRNVRGKFFIQVARPSFQPNLPDELALFRPAERTADIFVRKSFAESLGPGGLKTKPLSWKSNAKQRRAFSDEIWWR